jgi:hypothetical protein
VRIAGLATVVVAGCVLRCPHIVQKRSACLQGEWMVQ